MQLKGSALNKPDGDTRSFATVGCNRRPSWYNQNMFNIIVTNVNQHISYFSFQVTWYSKSVHDATNYTTFIPCFHRRTSIYFTKTSCYHISIYVIRMETGNFGPTNGTVIAIVILKSYITFQSAFNTNIINNLFNIRTNSLTTDDKVAVVHWT